MKNLGRSGEPLGHNSRTATFLLREAIWGLHPWVSSSFIWESYRPPPYKGIVMSRHDRPRKLLREAPRTPLSTSTGPGAIEGSAGHGQRNEIRPEGKGAVVWLHVPTGQSSPYVPLTST